jgi:hypothetical protein
MIMKRVIKSFVAVALIAAHLMVSGGLMMVIHTCAQHHTKDVTTFSVINPVNEEENCCGTEEHEGNDSHIATACCEYNTSGFSLSSFVTASCLYSNALLAIAEIQTIRQVAPEQLFQTSSHNSFHNKHGGRYIVNLYHQILS